MADVAAVTTTVIAIRKNKVGVETEKLTTKQTEEVTTHPLHLVHFNISGQKFVVSDELVKKYSESKLASPHLLNDHWVEDLKSFYFDRDPALFNSVLNILRYNVLNVPSGYDKDLVMEEINFWEIPTDGVKGIHDDEESRLETEFQWLENRIPPPPPNSSKFMKLRYKWWCFITDPLGPHTEFRKLSFAYAVITIIAVFMYLVLYGLGTSAYYRIPDEYTNWNEKNSTASNMKEAVENIGCSNMKKIECYIRSSPKPWIMISKRLLMTFFIAETTLRLLLCPGWAYFKSVINWIDIITGKCATISFILEAVFEAGYLSQSAEMELHQFYVIMQSVQVMRIFKLFQYATLMDGLMIMILTLKACLKELLLLILYLMIAMFLFATIISFTEMNMDTGVGIPDCIYGYWWAIITMTTVGYGDYYPVSTGGYFIGVMCSITGLILTALPVAIIGSKFNVYWEHNRKRRQQLMACLQKEQEAKEACEFKKNKVNMDFARLEIESVSKSEKTF